MREEERRRIAREIHDELGQILTVARIDLTRLGARLDSPKDVLQQSIDDLMLILENASDTARSISENLRPGMLDLLGLGPALQSHVKQFEESAKVQCSLDMSNDGEIEVDDHVATVAFRIVQEALTNVARHAQASQVEILVVDLGEELSIIIQDNGIGVDNLAEKQKRRFGLLGMRERTDALGGSVTVTSEPGEGVRIEASLPYSMGASE